MIVLVDRLGERTGSAQGKAKKKFPFALYRYVQYIHPDLSCGGKSQLGER